jgi:hypothetical protein
MCCGSILCLLEWPKVMVLWLEVLFFRCCIWVATSGSQNFGATSDLNLRGRSRELHNLTTLGWRGIFSVSCWVKGSARRSMAEVPLLLLELSSSKLLSSRLCQHALLACSRAPIHQPSTYMGHSSITFRRDVLPYINEKIHL